MDARKNCPLKDAHLIPLLPGWKNLHHFPIMHLTKLHIHRLPLHFSPAVALVIWNHLPRRSQLLQASPGALFRVLSSLLSGRLSPLQEPLPLVLSLIFPGHLVTAFFMPLSELVLVCSYSTHHCVVFMFTYFSLTVCTVNYLRICSFIFMSIITRSGMGWLSSECWLH